MTSNERNILTITCFGHFLSHFNMLVFPAVALPLATRLDMPLADVLALSFWMYLLFGLTALPWGIIADRWRAVPLMKIYYGAAGLFGLAASFWMDQPGVLAVCLAGIGLFSGIYHPAGLGMISKHIQRISFAMGINGMFGNLGLAMAPLAAGVVTWFWGPRAAYLVMGGLNILGLVIMVSLRLEVHEQERATQTDTSNGSRGFLILLVAMMLGGIAYRGATVITPAYFEIRNQALFESLSQLLPADLSANLVATTITSLIFMVGMVGQYIGGRIAEHYSLPKSYLVFHLLTIPPVMAMARAANLPLVLLALVYFFFLLGMQPIENTLVSRLTPSAWRHSAFGMKFVLTFGVGALSVKGIGYIETYYRIQNVYLALGAVSVLLVMSIGVLTLRLRQAGGTRSQDRQGFKPA